MTTQQINKAITDITNIHGLDFYSDLNACHDMEETMTPEQWNQYDVALYNLTARKLWREIIHATAAQKCEAFLKATNLWKD